MKQYLNEQEKKMLYNELLNNVDYPIETNFAKNFVEMIGSVGGDYVRLRAYLTIDNEIKIYEK